MIQTVKFPMLMLKTTTWLLCNLLHHNLLGEADKRLLVQQIGVPALMKVEDETIVEDGLLICMLAPEFSSLDATRLIYEHLKHSKPSVKA